MSGIDLRVLSTGGQFLWSEYGVFRADDEDLPLANPLDIVLASQRNGQS